ncbi:hypothetical protein [Acinetobacter variabilis]|uniref:hypothetical protein n=1 Tax=Acinetobacter variabilis TaxID=70346 RepID=UPI00267195C7|nr:hypothetical protein [Acinetobacter variabilis]WKT72194.1 hypothetical protein Q3F87_10035 [Acinetobacter variabilis]
MSDITEVQQISKSQLLDGLIASNAKLFIGGHSQELGRKGKFISPIMKNLTPLELYKVLQETFGTDAITHSDLKEFKLDIEKMLMHFTDHILNMIQSENNNLFKRIIEYDKKGTLRMFEVYYSRLVQGKLKSTDTVNPTVATIVMRINNLYAHYMKELDKIPDFDINKNIKYLSINYELIHPVLVTKENFFIVLNLLMMHTACEYYSDKSFFSTETIIQSSIDNIRSKLFKLFNGIPYNQNTNLGNVYLFNLWRTDIDKFDQAALQTQYSFTTKTLSTMMETIAYKNPNNSNEIVIRDKLVFEQEFYFETLLELMGFLNSFEQMYITLKLNAKNLANNNGSEVDVVKKFTFLLNEHNLPAEQH